jgi:septum formation protein
MRFVLASRSPRRRELLAQVGLAPEVRPAGTDEAVRPGEAAPDYVLRVAREKARAVEGDVVLAADTSVVLDGVVLGQPADDADAARMLRALSGRAHEVLTAVCVRGPGGEDARVVRSEVEFVALDEARIRWYVASGEPRDKAGAYAVQGAGGAFVRAVRGSVSNVVGLPLAETLELLAAAGVAPPWSAA